MKTANNLVREEKRREEKRREEKRREEKLNVGFSFVCCVLDRIYDRKRSILWMSNRLGVL